MGGGFWRVYVCYGLQYLRWPTFGRKDYGWMDYAGAALPGGLRGYHYALLLQVLGWHCFVIAQVKCFYMFSYVFVFFIYTEM